MGKHTPGPWTENACEVQAPDGSPICETLARPEDRDKWRPVNGGVADANSRLICAAPDLLAALESLHDACEYWEDQEDPVLKSAREAIAKARGGE